MMHHMGSDRKSPSSYSYDEAKKEMRKTSNALFYGSICNFFGGLLILMSFASPYWLQSWEETQSEFKNMGLWEMCFYRFRHPDYQFDHLFTGCHAIYGDEYRLIREKLLPGWLMVVQLFFTLGLISSFLGQIIIVGLILRFPLEIILRFEWQFCTFTTACNAFTALMSFLSVAIFGGECWNRDWLLYPNFNYVSWSYAFAVIGSLFHIIAAILLYLDTKSAKERKERNKALIMQMQPPAFGSSSTYHAAGGAGAYI